MRRVSSTVYILIAFLLRAVRLLAELRSLEGPVHLKSRTRSPWMLHTPSLIFANALENRSILLWVHRAGLPVPTISLLVRR
jgi:hypothetical protein